MWQRCLSTTFNILSWFLFPSVKLCQCTQKRLHENTIIVDIVPNFVTSLEKSLRPGLPPLQRICWNVLICSCVLKYALTWGFCGWRDQTLSLHTSTGIRFWTSAQVMLLVCSQGKRIHRCRCRYSNRKPTSHGLSHSCGEPLWWQRMKWWKIILSSIFTESTRHYSRDMECSCRGRRFIGKSFNECRKSEIATPTRLP